MEERNDRPAHRKTDQYNILGFIGNGWKGDIAIDDLYITAGTCKGLFDQEEICVDVEGIISKETFCPKGYLDLQNARILFDPEREKCSDIYDQTKKRLLTDCGNVADSQKCLFDLSTDIRSQPECFQLYEFRIQHTCEVSGKDDTLPTVIQNSNDSATGLVVGLVIAALLLACVVILIVVLVRRRTFVRGPKEKITNNLRENDYIGSQDIALPQTDDPFSQIQNDGSRITNLHGYDKTHDIAKIKNVNKERVQSPAYAVRRNTTLSDKQTINADKYSIVDQTAETSFNRTIHDRTVTADKYMVLDPTVAGFNRTQLSKTPTGYKFAKPVKDTENKIGDEDQYALSEEGVYDHSGSNRHKELEYNIYNHAVDTIYDSGCHKRNDVEKEDTYDHFFGQKTEDDYDISTTTSTHA
ncbi:unnamed protein product [Mytilus coruscus]|uniref:SRCR domain-containing protein n=1 Tax=Mytilus coruscus TaxID=42192 RepID=A0A6J7ZWF8_MYTCO|nr:unnamed protein product [Mytilus coruscus]